MIHSKVLYVRNIFLAYESLILLGNIVMNQMKNLELFYILLFSIFL